jgi:hypothetical protein
MSFVNTAPKPRRPDRLADILANNERQVLGGIGEGRCHCPQPLRALMQGRAAVLAKCAGSIGDSGSDALGAGFDKACANASVSRTDQLEDRTLMR